MIKNTETIIVEVADISDNHIEEMKKLPHVYAIKKKEDRLIINCSGGKHNIISIIQYLQDEDVAIGSVVSKQPTLNDVFLEITGKELRD